MRNPSLAYKFNCCGYNPSCLLDHCITIERCTCISSPVCDHLRCLRPIELHQVWRPHFDQPQRIKLITILRRPGPAPIGGVIVSCLCDNTTLNMAHQPRPPMTLDICISAHRHTLPMSLTLCMVPLPLFPMVDSCLLGLCDQPMFIPCCLVLQQRC